MSRGDPLSLATRPSSLFFDSQHRRLIFVDRSLYRNHIFFSLFSTSALIFSRKIPLAPLHPSVTAGPEIHHNRDIDAGTFDLIPLVVGTAQ